MLKPSISSHGVCRQVQGWHPWHLNMNGKNTPSHHSHTSTISCDSMKSLHFHPSVLKWVFPSRWDGIAGCPVGRWLSSYHINGGQWEPLVTQSQKLRPSRELGIPFRCSSTEQSLSWISTKKLFLYAHLTVISLHVPLRPDTEVSKIYFQKIQGLKNTQKLLNF